MFSEKVLHGLKKMRLSLRVISHPIDSYEEFKRKKLFSVPAALVLVVLLFLARVYASLETGFGFNTHTEDMNVVLVFASTVVVVFGFVTVNYLLSTLMDGKGFYKEILCATAYALIPYVAATYLSTAISRVVLAEEYAFVTYIQVAGVVWTALLLIIALKSIHEYSLSKTLVTMILTVVGMVLSAALAVLCFAIYQQVIDIFRTIVNEIKFRQ